MENYSRDLYIKPLTCVAVTQVTKTMVMKGFE